MNGADLIRAVDFVHREKNIPKEVIFASIEKAVRLAILKIELMRKFVKHQIMPVLRRGDVAAQDIPGQNHGAFRP